MRSHWRRGPDPTWLVSLWRRETWAQRHTRRKPRKKKAKVKVFVYEPGNAGLSAGLQERESPEQLLPHGPLREPALPTP